MLAIAVCAAIAFAPSAPVARRSLAASPCVHTMIEVSAGDVKTLRQKTGAGMMDCKGALKECDGDMDKAADMLRAKGLAAAGKRASKATSEGMIEVYIHTGSKLGVMVEVRREAQRRAREGPCRAKAAPSTARRARRRARACAHAAAG